MRASRYLTVVICTTLLLAGCATRHTSAPLLVDGSGAKVKTHYQGELKADDGTLIRFTVYQPALPAGASAPLLLQTHPFGFWRLSSPRTPLKYILTSADVARRAWNDGYWVISFDQRGHGDSGDVMHIADPQKEARDVSQVIDWALANLAVTAVDGDPRVGMVGESYGAGIQLVASAIDPRIDALVPIGGWYDLERTLAPNEVPKSGWLTLLVVAGNTLADYDNRLNGAYLRARGGVIEPWVREEFDDHDVSWFCQRGQTPKADALIIQGFRDVLFPVNEGLDVHACLKQAGRDARFIGVEDGHLLPGAQRSPGLVPGWNIEKNLRCDGRTQKTREVVLAWLDAKLRDRAERLDEVPVFCLTGDTAVDATGAPPERRRFELARAHVGSGASGLVEWAARPLDHVKNWFVPADGDNWQRPRNGWLRPALIPVHRAAQAEWVVGVPRVSITIDEADREAPVLFLQVAAWRPGSGTWRILSQQVTPVRGTGRIDSDLVAVRGRLEPGEVVGLLVRGYQSQYRFSGSGWGTDASVHGSIELPLAAAGAPEDGGDSQDEATAAR